MSTFIILQSKSKGNIMRQILIVIALSLAGNAQALVLDFEEFDTTFGTVDQVTSGILDVKEFTFTGYGGNPYNLAIDNSGAISNDPTTVLAYCPFCTMDMEHSQGDLFTLFSLDLTGSITPGDVTIIGYIDGGPTVEKTVSYGHLNMQAVSFGSEWTQLEKVEFGLASTVGFGISIDNVVVAPIPAALWLFGSALACLGWLRRKTTF
jgi:hypothetical protein